MKPLLDKTDRLLKRKDKLKFSNQVKEIVIKKKISIDTALKSLEKI